MPVTRVPRRRRAPRDAASAAGNSQRPSGKDVSRPRGPVALPPAPRFAIMPRTSPPWSRSSAASFGSADRSDRRVESPAQIPVTSASTRTDAASRPMRRRAKSKTDSSSTLRRGGTNGSPKTRRRPPSESTSEPRNDSGPAGSSRSLPPRTTNRRSALAFARVRRGLKPKRTQASKVAGTSSRNPVGPHSQR